MANFTLFSSLTSFFSDQNGAITGDYWGKSNIKGASSPLVVDDATPASTFIAGGVNSYTVYITAQDADGHQQTISTPIEQTNLIKPFNNLGSSIIFSSLNGVTNGAVLFWQASSTAGAYDLEYEPFTETLSNITTTTPAVVLSGNITALETAVVNPIDWQFSSNSNTFVLSYETQNSTSDSIYVQGFNPAGQAQTGLETALSAAAPGTNYLNYYDGVFGIDYTEVGAGLQFEQFDATTGAVTKHGSAGIPAFTSYFDIGDQTLNNGTNIFIYDGMLAGAHVLQASYANGSPNQTSGASFTLSDTTAENWSEVAVYDPTTGANNNIALAYADAGQLHLELLDSMGNQIGSDFIVPGATNLGRMISLGGTRVELDYTVPDVTSGGTQVVGAIYDVTNASAPLQHSFVAGGTVFIDKNGNGILDAGEPSTITAANGDFSLIDTGSAPLALIGGTSLEIGIPTYSTLYAPAGSTFISVLTSEIVAVSYVQGISTTNANAEVVASLGLPSGTDLTTLDQDTGAEAGDQSSLLAFAKNAEAANLSSLIIAAGGSVSNAAGVTASANFYSQPVSFTNIASLSAFAISAGVASVQANAAAQIVAASSSLIDQIVGSASSATTPTTIISDLLAIVDVIEGNGAASLTAAGSDASNIGNVVNQYTGNNLLLKVGLPIPSIGGVAEDGYIAGATVFADANGNGVLDAGEVSTTTDAKGNFTLVGGSGPLVLKGGTDITTGLALTGTLQAPAGASVISPLTTIVQIVATTQGISAAAANASVVASLGLTAGTNLATLDAQTGAMAGNATATAVFAAQTQVANALSLITGAGGNLASNSAQTAIAAAFTSNSSVLTNATALATLAMSAGVTAANAAAVGDIGSASNALIATTASSGASAASTVATIAAAATVAQGAATTSLMQAVANPSTLAATTTAYTGNNLVQATTQAGGTLTAPSVTLSGTGGTITILDPTLTGTVDLADASGTVQIYANGKVLGAPVAISAQGTFATTLALPGDGTFAITAAKANASGAVGTSNAVSLTLNSLPNQSLFGAVTHDVTSPGGNIFALYETILGRAPDALGLETWVTALNTGTSLATIAGDFLSSGEYASDYGSSVQSNDAFINQLYQDGLHRQADPSGLKTWENALATGTSRAQVAIDIATSGESQQDLGATFQAGVFVPDATDSAVARLYYGVIGRAPDAGGLRTFETAVHSGGLSLTQAAQSFLGSSEYQGTAVGQSNLRYIEGLYQTALGRTGDAGGVQTYETALDTGTATRATVADAFLGSSEFQTDEAGQANSAYVNTVYQAALGRQADPNGLQTWDALLAGGTSRVAVAQDIVGSAEFAANVTAPAQATFVNALYEGALGRPADAGGLQANQNAIAGGASLASIVLGVTQSPEAVGHLAPAIETGFHIA